MDSFSDGFVEIIAAEQTPDNPNWFQGTADAVRQAVRHFADYDANYYLILAAIISTGWTTAADERPCRPGRPTSRSPRCRSAPPRPHPWACSNSTAQARSWRSRRSRPAERLARIGSSIPSGTPLAARAFDPDKPFIASMGIYVFSRDVLLELLEKSAGTDFGREIIPAALNRYRVNAYLHEGYWADVGTVESFYDANILLTQPRAPFSFYDPRRPIFTRQRFLPPSRFLSCTLRDSIVAEGCFLDECVVNAP